MQELRRSTIDAYPPSRYNMTHYGLEIPHYQPSISRSSTLPATSRPATPPDNFELSPYPSTENLRQKATDEESQMDDLKKHIHDQPQYRQKLGYKERIKHFTWAWYTLTMSTGGLALLISVQPFTSHLLEDIGFILYISNIILFLGVTGTMASRFIIHRGLFTASIVHPREGLFVATFFLSIATITTGTQKYLFDIVGSGLLLPLRIAFWTYSALTFTLAVVQYSHLFRPRNVAPLKTMTPAWLLPTFPIMLAGTLASVLAGSQPTSFALEILVAGLTFQGLGFILSILFYAHYIGRLMSEGAMNREHRTGMFIAVGPPSFTALALLGMANSVPLDFKLTSSLADGSGTVEIDVVPMLRLMALLSAIFLLALALFFFFIAAVSVLRLPPKHFHLGWWAMVFPNSGFAIAIISLGRALDSLGFLILGAALSVCIGLLWIFVLVGNARSVLLGGICWPGKDEDVVDH